MGQDGGLSYHNPIQITELNNVIVVVVILIGFWDLHPREGGLGTQPSDGCELSFWYDPVYGPYTPLEAIGLNRFEIFISST